MAWPHRSLAWASIWNTWKNKILREKIQKNTIRQKIMKEKAFVLFNFLWIDLVTFANVFERVHWVNVLTFNLTNVITFMQNERMNVRGWSLSKNWKSGRGTSLLTEIPVLNASFADWKENAESSLQIARHICNLQICSSSFISSRFRFSAHIVFITLPPYPSMSRNGDYEQNERESVDLKIVRS